jgi:NAD(P)H-dependent flavin oxidoreductase YrpB (nitropropane dioxygenase family)
MMASQGSPSNELCTRLGIEVPIINAPMSEEAGPELAIAVSEAGGLGMLGHGVTPLEDVRDHIREVKRSTSKPFGVGLLFPLGDNGASAATEDPKRPFPEFLMPLVGPGGLPDKVSSRRQALEVAEQRLAIAIEERVPILACGLGAPERIVGRAKSAGMFVMALVGSVRAARAAEASGVDAIIAQGHEAGGHTGRTSTLALVPKVVDSVRVPVIAAGGIVDGRSLAAMLLLGAQAVLVGTRFLATHEARTAVAHKQAIVAMQDDDTLVSRCFTGKPSRVIRNRFTDAWRGHEAEILPMPAQMDLVRPLVEPAKKQGLLDIANWPTGQGAVGVKRIMPAADVVGEMIDEARSLLARAAMLA